MTLFLIRHGETALNAARIVQPAATPLSPRGAAQAQALASRLVDKGLRAILSSDLPRALATAQAIAACTGLPIETTPLLRERNFGDWRGLPYDAPGVALATRDAPPGGESSATFEARVDAAFALALERQAGSGGTLAVVTHGLVIGSVLARLVALDDETSAPLHLGNTGLTIVDSEPPHRVRLLDSTTHLEAGPRDDPNALSGG